MKVVQPFGEEGCPLGHDKEKYLLMYWSRSHIEH